MSDNPSDELAAFVGRIDRRIDAKGRLALPPELRHRRVGIYWKIGEDFVRLAPLSVWNEWHAESMLHPKTKREFSLRSAVPLIDRIHRFQIPSGIAGRFGDLDVAYIGAGDYFELWDPVDFEKAMKETAE